MLDPAEVIREFLHFLWQYDVSLIVDDMVYFKKSLQELLDATKDAKTDPDTSKELLAAIEEAVITLAGELEFLEEILKEGEE